MVSEIRLLRSEGAGRAVRGPWDRKLALKETPTTNGKNARIRRELAQAPEKPAEAPKSHRRVPARAPTRSQNQLRIENVVLLKM